MIYEDWLGRKWGEVEPQVEGSGVAHTLVYAYPWAKVRPCGCFRVVRIRERNNSLEFVLAPENVRIEDGPTP